MSRIAQQIALGCGAAGAMVDVSSYVDLEAGVSRQPWRTNEFDDATPGEFSFTLDNGDGRFTPDNAAILATPLTEGMAVSWLLGTRLVSGTVRGISPVFPDAEAAWSQVEISCDDMLGDAARLDVNGLADAMVRGDVYAYWPLDDEFPLNATFASERSGNNQPPLSYLTPGATASSVDGFGAINEQPQLQMLHGTIRTVGYTPNPFATIAYAAGSAGVYGVWCTPKLFLANGGPIIYLSGMGGNYFRFGPGTGGFYELEMGTNKVTATVPVAVDVPVFLSVALTHVTTTDLTGELFVNGVSQGSAAWSGAVDVSTNALKTTRRIGLFANTLEAINFAHLSHTAALVHEELAQPVSAASRLVAIEQALPELTLAPSAGLSASVLTYQGNGSILDLLNEIITNEQGHIYTVTTGTLTAPVQSIVIRDRDRPETVTTTFNAEDEAQGAPEFLRDITYLISSTDVDAGETALTVIDRTLIPRAGRANDSATILSVSEVDRLAWGQDRLQRGANTKLRVESIVIDAMTTPTDRSAALLALVPGDRVRINGLPNTQLAFTQWDGWFLGAEETHDLEQHKFELYFQPCLPDTAIYDTDRYMAGGELTLNTTVNSAVTSVLVSTGGSLFTTAGGDLPVNIIIDAEQMTVTAATGGAPQTLTVTRGAAGTTAAAHTAGALVELADVSLYAF